MDERVDEWDEADEAADARALRLAAYVDGELDAADAAAFEAEIALDPALRSEVESLRRLDGLAVALGAPAAVPAEAWTRAWGAIESQAFGGAGGAGERGADGADAAFAPVGDPLSDSLPEDLSGYLDGELDAAERARIEARLEAEPALRTELEALERVDRFARAAARAPALDEARWARTWRAIEHATFGRAASVSGRILALPRTRYLGTRALAIAAGLLIAVSFALTFAAYPGPHAGEQAVARSVERVTSALSTDAEDSIDAAGEESIMAFSSEPGANRIRIIELRTAGGVTPTVLFPEDNSQPVSILLNEL